MWPHTFQLLRFVDNLPMASCVANHHARRHDAPLSAAGRRQFPQDLSSPSKQVHSHPGLRTCDRAGRLLACSGGRQMFWWTRFGGRNKRAVCQWSQSAETLPCWIAANGRMPAHANVGWRQSRRDEQKGRHGLVSRQASIGDRIGTRENSRDRDGLPSDLRATMALSLLLCCAPWWLSQRRDSTVTSGGCSGSC